MKLQGQFHLNFIPNLQANLLLCSHSPNDVPPEPQRNVSIAAVRGAVRPSNVMYLQAKGMGKVYIFGSGHMTNMTAMPMYGKRLKILLLQNH